MVMCALPDNDVTTSSGNDAPCAVSVLTGEEDLQETRHPINVIPIVDLRERRARHQATLPTVNYTVCVPPIHGTQYDWTDLVEFIEVNRILGEYI